MTIAERPPRTRRAAARNVLAEIAERRRQDLPEILDGPRPAEGPPPRPVLDRLAEPGLHIIAELKRRSPSAGQIATTGDDLVARARAYEAGGAAAISVLCEPHWFGGSIDDVAAIRAAVGIPVLAKEFVVDSRQLAILRAAGADLVLLLAALHPPRRLRRLVELAIDLGLEPLVEAHDERETVAAIESGARLIGVNNRDLRTLEVDPERAIRLRAVIPEDRIAVAESGVHEPSTVAAWRAVGFDAGLIGEVLVRSADPAAAVRAFVSAGHEPDDIVNRANRAMVKICGITDAAGAMAAVRAGAEAVGLNLVAGTPRELSIDEAVVLARLIRNASPAYRRPLIVAITANRNADELRGIASALEPDAVQLSGAEQLDIVAAVPEPVWKVIHLPTDEPEDLDTAVREVVERARAWLAAGVARIHLDTAGGPHPGGTGRRPASGLAAAVAREVPVTLAGGLDPTTVGPALRAIQAVGVDVASGVERPRTGGERARKDPFRVALFTKRAHAARHDQPNLPARPTPVNPGLLEADGHGRWGIDRDFGGRYVPETLMLALEQLERAYAELRNDPRFWSELRELLATYAGRETPIYRADGLAAEALDLARDRRRAGGRSAPETLCIYLKREDLAHTGAHKINNALGQALMTRRLGKTRVIAETGAGQHGVATATACALLELPCVVYMGAEDIERQQPNVLRMQALGAEVRSVTSGSATLKDAINDAMRDWVTNVETTHYVLGSAMGPHPYPTIVRDLQRRIGDEAAVQVADAEGRLPDLVLACVGGGSNAIGLLDRFIGEPGVRLAVSEAAGDGIETGRHAAALAGGSAGILHGARSLMLQDADGQVLEAHSASAGLDYPGVGPQIAALVTAGRVELAAATDDQAFAAMEWLARTEGILPALESAHALAALPDLLAGATGSGQPYPSDVVVLVGLSGRGDKDLAPFGRWRERRAGAA
jgi:tryptophan synthase beta subunit